MEIRQIDDLPPEPEGSWREEPDGVGDRLHRWNVGDRLQQARAAAGGVVRIVQKGPVLRSLAFGLAALAALAAVVMVARWDAAADRDNWWRDEIARKSSAVREIIRSGGSDIIDGDAARVADLEREKNELRDELEILRAERARTALSLDCDRCRIPARRLRAGQAGG